MVEVSEDTKKALRGARTEIIAGGVLLPITDADKAWNRANERAARIIDGYLRGEGLFQIETKKETVNVA